MQLLYISHGGGPMPLLGEAERHRCLAEWDKAPHARFCHPLEEHLLPLHVCYGMAGKASDYQESLTVLGKRSKMIGWEHELSRNP